MFKQIRRFFALRKSEKIKKLIAEAEARAAYWADKNPGHTESNHLMIRLYREKLEALRIDEC